MPFYVSKYKQNYALISFDIYLFDMAHLLFHLRSLGGGETCDIFLGDFQAYEKKCTWYLAGLQYITSLSVYKGVYLEFETCIETDTSHYATIT